ncbi:MAG: acetyl-CoA carboxylase carboxyltransferase subunit beta [Armatimonadetes bacterium]|nr:acetyl-CoA carboxylase carboxyltransferase subunit beta [Armatimonadota bacterium]
MPWWSRNRKNLDESQNQQREMPDGLWTKCPSCETVIYKSELEENLYTCPKCDHHFRIGSNHYIDLLTDPETFDETHAQLTSTDPLEFVDEDSYQVKLRKATKRTGLSDAMRTGLGQVEGKRVSLAIMDFSFIGGSMGSVVGEKFCRAVDDAIRERVPFICITASGGARMMEAAISLMQMAKTSTRLTLLADERIPYIVILTDPTTGGVTASYAMLGDVTLAEPRALIGFAGPRVIEQTIKRKLPEGFQRSEFQQEHGFVDHIVHRKELRKTLSRVLTLLPIPETAD